MYPLDEGNVITIGLDTQTVFYQSSKFYTGQNIQILKLEELNKNTAIFLITLLKKQIAKFTWGGNGATLTRLRKTKIFLPATPQGSPDYNYMAQYIRHIEQQQIRRWLRIKAAA